MPQKKNKKTESGDLILRDVEREMAKPRLAESVRKAAVNGGTDKSSTGKGEL
jgi:hypothetical protein